MDRIPKPIKRELIEESCRKAGVEFAAPDAPIYREGSSVTFLRPRSSCSTPAEQVVVTDLEKATSLFREARLAFPTIPPVLAARLRERNPWLYSTRSDPRWPYFLDQYVSDPYTDDYAVLSHSGHGVNSYAIHYYLVFGGLAMFLQIGWGGCDMDNDEARDTIRACFALADEIAFAAQSKLTVGTGDRLTIVISDLYRSYWLRPGEKGKEYEPRLKCPIESLIQVRDWITGQVGQGDHGDQCPS